MFKKTALILAIFFMLTSLGFAGVTATYTDMQNILLEAKFNTAKTEKIADPNNPAGARIQMTAYTPVTIKATGKAVAADGVTKNITITRILGADTEALPTLATNSNLLGNDLKTALATFVTQENAYSGTKNMLVLVTFNTKKNEAVINEQGDTINKIVYVPATVKVSGDVYTDDGGSKNLVVAYDIGTASESQATLREIYTALSADPELQGVLKELVLQGIGTDINAK